jgi:hypothetical protein
MGRGDRGVALRPYRIAVSERNPAHDTTQRAATAIGDGGLATGDFIIGPGYQLFSRWYPLPFDVVSPS